MIWGWPWGQRVSFLERILTDSSFITIKLDNFVNLSEATTTFVIINNQISDKYAIHFHCLYLENLNRTTQENKWKFTQESEK